MTINNIRMALDDLKGNDTDVERAKAHALLDVAQAIRELAIAVKQQGNKSAK